MLTRMCMRICNALTEIQRLLQRRALNCCSAKDTCSQGKGGAKGELALVG